MKVKAKDIVHDHIVDDLDNENLTIGKVYCVIGIEGDYYRVINDDNEPIIYSKELFGVFDPTIPNDWIKTVFEGEIYLDPPETSEAGFYEDYFDDIPYAKEIYRNLLKKMKAGKLSDNKKINS